MKYKNSDLSYTGKGAYKKGGATVLNYRPLEATGETMEINTFECFSKRKREVFGGNKANSPIPVKFQKLFRFASNTDVVLIVVSVTASVLEGVCFPAWIILYGSLAKVLIEGNDPDWNIYCKAINSSCTCQNSSSLENSKPIKYKNYISYIATIN